MLKLQFTDNRQASFWIVDETFGIGSQMKNQMVIKDDQVQPFHATIHQKNHRLFITPCSTEALTFINGEHILDATEIKVGDVIRLNTIELRLIDPSRHAKSPTPSDKLVAKPLETLNWQIKAMTGPLAGKTVSVDSSKIIGRDPAADIVISGGHVSRRHAELLLREGQLWVRDLNSSNGTYVNNRKTEEQALYLGDEVKFDAVIFRVVVGKSAPKEKDGAASDVQMDKTQFRPALNIPIASKPVESPRPASIPMPEPIVPAVPKTPEVVAKSSVNIPVIKTDEKSKGVQISPTLIIVMLIVLMLLAALIVVGMR